MTFIKRLQTGLCFFLLVITRVTAQSVTEKLYTKQQLQQDFAALRKHYETSLANLYLYTAKPQMDKLFDSLYQSISTMNEREFFNYITPLQSIVKDGHSLILPSKQTTKFHQQHSRYFPFQVYIDSGRLYTVMNFTSDTSIADGTEILAINGKTTTQIIDFLMRRQVRDGNNQTFPLWILNHYFRGYYNISFSYPETYLLKIKTTDNQISEVQVNGTTQDSIAIYKKLRYTKQLATNTKGIYLDTKGNTAILTIKTWDTKWLRTIYHQNFCKEIDDIFKHLQQNRTTHLIIDLRDNQGGSSQYGDYLLGYLLNQPYQYITGLYKVKLHTDTGQLLKQLSGSFMRTHQPHKNNFTGKLYVLTNGGSFSNSGIFSSCIEKYERGIFIGEETGGNKTVLTGVFGIGNKTVLPNTKIICDRANYRMVITDLKTNTAHGVMPTYQNTPTVNEVIQQTDVVLNKVLELIKQNQ